MKLKTIRYWQAALMITVALASPFGAWAMDETSLRAAAVLSVIGGLTAAKNWFDQSLIERTTKSEE